MFEKLFERPDVVQQHRTGPFAEARLRFLNHRAKLGASRLTLVGDASWTLEIARWIDLSSDHRITIQELEAARTNWQREQAHLRRILRWRNLGTQFIPVAKRWLRFLGRFEEPKPEAPAFEALIEDYAAAMREERNLASATICGRRKLTRVFLRWLDERHLPLERVSIRDIDAFHLCKRKQGWTRITMADSAHILRTFFRHAEARGWCRPGISTVIDGPRIYHDEAPLARGPAWEEVQGLLAYLNTDHPSDIRDRAIVMLLAIYGVRAKEVSQLRLDDLDWEQETISITRAKRGRPQPFPLVREVGDAILRYLREVRPRCQYRQLFLTCHMPIVPLTPGALYMVVRTNFDDLGIAPRHRGPHSLRHACATHLMKEGFSLKEIGDHLGHHRSDSTRVYARVDLDALREVGNFDLGGVL